MEQIPLIGYADRFSVMPGETIEFKVSSTSAEPYTAKLVRVVSCDPNPKGPGIIEQAVEANFTGLYPSRVQVTSLGSYMQASRSVRFDDLESFTLCATIWPTTPRKDLQGVITKRGVQCAMGFALAVDVGGVVAMLGTQRVAVGKPLIERRWYRVWATYDAATQILRAGQQPLRARFDADDAGTASTSASPGPGTVHSAANLLVAAFDGTPPDGYFNGKIEAAMLLDTALDDAAVTGLSVREIHPAAVACWDFAQSITSPKVIDIGPHRIDGRLVNLPTRAMKGAAWDGSSFSWTERPEHYAAIHFHDDDIYDCEWATDFAFEVPADFRSGVYAVRLESREGAKEMIPFFVTPRDYRAQSRIAVLIPTFTYTVYANIARGNTTDSLRATIAAWDGWPYTADDHAEYGLSTYNYHSDGSGIAYSSRRRPIITMRSATISYPDVPGSALRHFAADGHLWYWLEKKGYDFDVLTDDDLHRVGATAISSYDVVMSTTHPEYHTTETLDALAAYTEDGGHFMYLGGNGFYWKIALSEAWPDAIEIRRGEGGIRAWAAEPGEYYNAFDGTYGGLWRRNGRPPQALVGVGFTSQGGHVGDHYRRTAVSHDPDYAWIFAGTEGDVIGDFGLSGGGAAGFELDRADPRLGTPRNAVVLASSEGHGDHFVLVPEDILTDLRSWNGEEFKDLIRSDIVYFETPKGGAVFSVGSITFCGSLPVNDCDNNISRMVANVLNRFLG